MQSTENSILLILLKQIQTMVNLPGLRFLLIMCAEFFWFGSSVTSPSNLPIKKIPQEIFFSHITRDNGLPSNFIYNALQDKQGYVWIATDNGLVRYDGHDVKVFRHIRGDNTSIADNTILSLMLDKNALLWIGTQDGSRSLWFDQHLY